jgi:hypothetical protein
VSARGERWFCVEREREARWWTNTDNQP